MPLLDRFEVTVLVDGEHANEYDDDEAEVNPDHPNAISKYVEVVSGAFFEFQVRIDQLYFPGQEDAITAYVYVDGKFATGWVIPVKNRSGQPLNTLGDRRSKISGIISNSKDTPGVAVMQKFQFSDLELRDTEKGDDTSTFKEKYGELGTFRLELWREVTLGSTNFRDSTPSDFNAVPEKALKGKPLDVATRYVSVPTYAHSHAWQTDGIDALPIAVFNYKYRTRRALQSLFIIERSPTPAPLEDRPIEELSREEMAELLRRQREQREQKQIKEEHGINRPFKRERTAQHRMPMKFSRGPKGEKIYHLDSDSENDGDNNDDEEVEVTSGEKETKKVEIIEL